VIVDVGISDGTATAVLGGPLAEGASVVTSIEERATAPSSEGSPLLPFGGRPPDRTGGRQGARP
jgi:hypothetical protein